MNDSEKIEALNQIKDIPILDLPKALETKL